MKAQGWGSLVSEVPSPALAVDSARMAVRSELVAAQGPSFGEGGNLALLAPDPDPATYFAELRTKAQLLLRTRLLQVVPTESFFGPWKER